MKLYYFFHLYVRGPQILPYLSFFSPHNRHCLFIYLFTTCITIKVNLWNGLLKNSRLWYNIFHLFVLTVGYPDLLSEKTVNVEANRYQCSLSWTQRMGGSACFGLKPHQMVIFCGCSPTKWRRNDEDLPCCVSSLVFPCK